MNDMISQGLRISGTGMVPSFYELTSSRTWRKHSNIID